MAQFYPQRRAQAPLWLVDGLVVPIYCDACYTTSHQNEITIYKILSIYDDDKDVHTYTYIYIYLMSDAD
jgi:hypothetical protein